MRALVAVLLVLVAAPFASADLLPPTPLTAPPEAHGVLDATAYRAQVDAAVGFALGYQKPDGGIYEYSFLLRDQDASLALVLLANDAQTPVDGPEMAALLAYWEAHQNVDGSFGSGCCVPTFTSNVLRGLLDAGYDTDSLIVQRALAYLRLTQDASGGWNDGGFVASHQTAWDVELLLRTGAPRDDLAVQRAMQFILTTRNPDNGGFAPIVGFFETEAVTAQVVGAFERYLRTPAGAHELVAAADVEAALDGALGFLAARIDPATGYWQYNIGANAQIVGPVIRYHAQRGLAMPAWLLTGVQALLDHQAPTGGLTNNQGTVTVLDWTLEAFAGLLELPRALGASDSLPVQATVNRNGDWQAATVSVTLVDADGDAVAATSGPNGLLTLTWSGLAPGRYAVRVEADGAEPSETAVWL
jgi:hypothetical protein